MEGIKKKGKKKKNGWQDKLFAGHKPSFIAWFLFWQLHVPGMPILRQILLKASVLLSIEETGTKTCLMDTYLFRNPEEVSYLCSSKACVVWFWFLFKTEFIIWSF